MKGFQQRNDIHLTYVLIRTLAAEFRIYYQDGSREIILAIAFVQVTDDSDGSGLNQDGRSGSGEK